MQMGCISMSIGFTLQRPDFGLGLNLRKKKQGALVSVSRRHNKVITNSVSTSQGDSNILLKEETKFKSSFDKYLNAMESIRDDKDKKKAQKGSHVHKNQVVDAALSKDAPQAQQHGKDTNIKRFKGLGSKANDDSRRVSIKDARRAQQFGKSTNIKSFKASGSKENNEPRRVSIKDARRAQQFGKSTNIKSFKASGSKETDEPRRVSSKDAPWAQQSGKNTNIKSFKGSDSKENDEPRRLSSKDAPWVQQCGKSTNIKPFKGSGSKENDEPHRVLSKDAPWAQQHGKIANIKRFKGPAFKEKDEPRGVAGNGRLGGSVQARNSIRIDNKAKVVKMQDGSSKTLHVDSTPVSIPELVGNKRMPVSEIRTDNELEMKSFLFEQSELLGDVQDGPRVSRMEMEERIQKLAKSLDDADMDMPEWMFSKMMRSAQIRFSDHSMLRIIQILGKLGNWRRVLQVVEWLQMHERYRSLKIRYVYTAALDVLGKARRPVEALNLFCAMQRRMDLYPDIVAYHSIAVTLGQAGHMKELFDVIDSMRCMPKHFKVEALENWDPRLEPDIVVYNAVLNACVKRKEWEGAIWVLQKLAQVGQQPSSTTYGLAMEVMLASGKYDLVHEFYRQMLESSAPNALTYRVLVNTLWREGKPDEAIEAVQDMESRGIIGSASLYYDLARCLCSVGRCDEALMQVDKICKVASKPLVVTYTGLIQACFDHGNVDGGTSIFNHMQKYCSPNLVTYNIMLKAYLEHGMFDEAKELFQKMTESGRVGSKVKGGITPDLHTFNLMLEACIREGKWDDFEYGFEQMLHHGHPFNTKRHLWMVLQASGAGKVEVVETTWRHLMQANRIPPPALIKERLRLKMEKDDLMSAVSTIASHPPSHQQSFSREAWSKLFEDNAHCFKKDALKQLIYEVETRLCKSESPNPIYQNLLQSCIEFLRLDKPFGDRRDFIETPA